MAQPNITPPDLGAIRSALANSRAQPLKSINGVAIRPIGGVNNNPDPAKDLIPGTPEVRLGPAHFQPNTTDGIIEGTNARTLSNEIAAQPPNIPPDAVRSDWLYVFGQFLDHDMDLTAPDPSRPISISVPAGDPNFPAGTVIPMGGRETSADGTVINDIVPYLDLSQVYGSDPANAASLRNADGTLKTSAGNAPPIDANGFFHSGDVRVGENPELSSVTALFIREHNFQVAALAKAHPNLTGDQLYDQARAITTAEYENIVFNEYLPSLLGNNAVPAYHGFNANVSAQISAEFSTAAFRIGHSQVSGDQAGIDNNGVETFSQSLATAFTDTPQQVVANGIDSLLRHVSSDNPQATDIYAVDELRNFLFAPPDAIDLIAIDIERERDVGLGTLNQARAAIGLTPYTSFNQITQDPATLARLQQAYGSVDNVDLFVGGLAETHVNGGTAGQTFDKIISDQFDKLQTGDRFFWRNQGFDQATAQSIANTTLSDILSRDSSTPDLQAHAFLAAERHLSNVAPENPAAAQLVIGIDDPNAGIAGGTNDDTIFAGKGLHQTLAGNGGSDVFVFANPGKVDDTVSDFNPSNDKLDLRALLKPSDMVQVKAETGGSVLHIASADIHLTGVAPGSLTTADFVQSVRLQIIGNA